MYCSDKNYIITQKKIKARAFFRKST